MEQRNRSVHPDPDNDQDIFRKIWNVECRKQETTYSQIGNKEEKIVLELVFYMIYTTPLTSNQIDDNGQPKDKKHNNERYPMREVS